MKKFIFSAIAAIGLLLSPSCSDENEALSGSGNEALVSFSVNLADGIQTKADPTTTTTLGNGRKAKNLVVDVFELNTTTSKYERIDGLRQKHDGAFENSLTTTVNFNLVKGKTYRFIFWAQAQSVENATNSPYGISDLSKITVDYHAGITDDENRDAFLGVTTDPITVSGNFTKSITMTRPFAQLNYLIDKAEYDAAVLAGMDIQKAKVTVAKVATELYPLKNSVGVPVADVEFEVTAIPTNFANLSGEDYLSLPEAGAENPTDKNYYYLASKYFLVYAGNGEADKAGVQANLATTSFKLVDGSNQDIANYEFSLPQVPVQRNFRTNIYGNLITSKGTFNVTIDPILNGDSNPDINLPQSAAVVDNPNEIAGKIAEGATTIIASESFNLSADNGDPTIISVPKTYAAVDNGVELTFDLSKATVTGSGTAEIKISYKSGDSEHAPENVNVIASGNITIELPDSHVTLNGAEVPGGTTYNTVTASTSGTTLVIPNGVTVETLKVKKGNVRIEKGGTVGTIVRTSDNEDTGNTIVFLEDGGELTNIPTDPQIIVQAMITTVDQLLAFAADVNNGNTYAGRTVVLGADIDLAGKNWKPIGGLFSYPGVTFAGTFDGNNHTISNLKTSDFTTNHATAGFFGSITGTVKNLTLTNVNITSSHYAGGIVGYSSANGAVIENCHVNGGTITSTPEYTGTTDDSTNGYDNGDKVGGIIGYMVVSDKVENCSVSNVTIKAYRDLGGIVGYAQNGGLTNNTVESVSLIQNITNGYKTTVPTTIGAIIGRDNANEGKPNDGNYASAVTKMIGVGTASDLKSVLEAAGSGKGDQIISITTNLDFTNIDWTPVNVQGYTGTGVITINGNNYKITGLKDALFAGGFAGHSGIVINDLTIDGQGVTIEDNTESQGWGYFIKNIDSMPKITLKNCHLKNANITSTGGARVGGLIGWTSGYNNQNDGPVDTYVTIENCSVTNSKITAKGSVGAIIGHAGSNPATYHTITGCTVTNCTLHSTDDGDWRVGVVVGTANVGEVTISNITASGNTLTQTDKTAPVHSTLYGRFVPQNGSGKLTIDGVAITE